MSAGLTEPEKLTEDTDDDVVLTVRDVKKHFPLTRGIVFKRTIGQVKAVDGVTLDLVHKNPGLAVLAAMPETSSSFLSVSSASCFGAKKISESPGAGFFEKQEPIKTENSIIVTIRIAVGKNTGENKTLLT